MKRKGELKTAVIQFNATDNKDRNVKRALNFVEKAAQAKAGFILLPEVFVYRGRLLDPVVRDKVIERIPGDTTALFSQLAKQYRVHILLGSLYEKSRDKKRVYNTSVLIDPTGKVSATYRKMNLFEAQIGSKKVRESDMFLPGKKFVLGRVGPFSVGLSICFDLRFGSLYNNYCRRGAQVLCVPSAFTQETGRAHWKTLLRARAIENFCYVLAPNQIGTDDRGIAYYGHSLIISPWGEIIQEASGYKEEVIYGTLELDQVKLMRKKIAIPVSGSH